MYEATALTIGSGLSTALGQYSQGQAAKGRGEFIGAQDDYRANVALQDAQDRAQLIRRAGSRAVGSADVATAASGIQVGTGSAGDVDREIYQQSEHDAYTALLTGSRQARAAEMDAFSQRVAGQVASKQAKAQMVATVLSSGVSAYKAWGGSFNAGAWDARGVNGTNDRSTLSTGSSTDWFQKYGTSGD